MIGSEGVLVLIRRGYSDVSTNVSREKMRDSGSFVGRLAPNKLSAFQPLLYFCFASVGGRLFELGKELCQMRAPRLKREPFSCAFLRFGDNCVA